jgi:hypothetical protein
LEKISKRRPAAVIKTAWRLSFVLSVFSSEHRERVVHIFKQQVFINR